MKKNTNFSRRTGNFNEEIQRIKREQQEKRERDAAELRKKREEDYELILLVCEALNNRIKEVASITAKAEIEQRTLTKEDTKVSLKDVEDFFKNVYGEKFPQKNRVAVLIPILVDLAKCQTNMKLLDYHVAIRLIYFGERFQAYFSPEFDQERYDLMKKFEDFLFFKWNITHVGFINKTNLDVTPEDLAENNSMLVMPIGTIGVGVHIIEDDSNLVAEPSDDKEEPDNSDEEDQSDEVSSDYETEETDPSEELETE